MIKITLHLPDQTPALHEFDQSIITIGSAEGQDIQLSVDEELIYPEHLKIVQEDKGYSIINLQQDPSTLLNQSPLSQSLLHSDDTLEIGNLSLHFQLETPALSSSPSADNTEELLKEAEEEVASLSESIQTPSSQDEDLEALLSDIELSTDDLQTLDTPPSSSLSEDLPQNLEADLKELEALLEENSLASSSSETSSSNLAESTPSAELTDTELEQMLLEIHGDESTKDDYQGAETGSLLSSLKEQEHSPEQSENAFDIEFLDEPEDLAKTQEVIEEQQEESTFEEEESPPEELSEIPAGSQQESYEDFGEYTEEKASSITKKQVASEEKKSTNLGFNTRQLLSIAAIYLITLFLLGLGLFATYSSVQSSNQYHMKLASRGVADYAMALTHNKLLPGKEKISDSLRAILPPQYLNNSEIYHTSTFKKAPYNLKAYFNDNQSNYLLIASPQGGMLQSIVPKSHLIIDSENMILKQSSSIDPLLKLLSQAENNLSLVDRSDLEALLDTYSLIYPKDLEENSLGFAPPSELAQLFPGSELYIYNSPRYYKFSQLLSKELDLFSSSSSVHLQSFQLLNRKFAHFNKFKQFVLYYSSKEEEAHKAFALLSTLFKKQGFPVGHLFFNTETGMIKGANILTKEEVSTTSLEEAKELAMNLEAMKEAKIERVKLLGSSSADASLMDFHSHPIYRSISEAVQSREEELEEASEQLMSQLRENSKTPGEEFDQEHLKANESYKSIHEATAHQLSLQLQATFDEQVAPNPKNHLPIFLAAINEYELDEFLGENISQQIDFFRKRRSSKKDIDGLLVEIENSSNFQSLHNLVNEMNESLQPAYFDKTTTFTITKNKFKKVVLNKIKQFILDHSHQQSQGLQREDRKYLEDILQVAKVDQGEELRFYLNEFDQLVEKFYSLPKKDTLTLLKQTDDKLVGEVENNVFLSEAQKNRIQAQSEETQAQISEQEKKIQEVQKQINQIPLRSYQASSSEKQKGVNSRIGQQILVRESLEIPSETRDQHLHEALNLLKEGTRHNRSLWADILQIRNLLSQTPEQKMLEVVHSEIGFDPKKAPLMSSIRKLSKKYLQAKGKLAEVANDQNRYFANRSFFASTQKETLEKMRDMSLQTQDLVMHFQNTLDTYIGKLEQFLLDYQKAKDEGFFVTDQQYHSVMSSRLSLKLKRFKKIKDAFEPTIEQILLAAQSHQEMSERELQELNTRTIIDTQNINELTEFDNEITYPDLASINIAKQINELLKIKISPIR